MRNRSAIGRQSFAWAEQISGYKLLSSIAYKMPVLPVGNDDHQSLADRDRSSAATSVLSRGRRRMTLEVSKLNRTPDPPVRKKVLIVEDNDLNMKLFNDLLVAHGYGTLQTKDGVEAIALIRQHHPDLILMDIQLPEISGLEVMQWIKNDDDLRMIPIIAVTSFAMKGDEEKIREGGCEAYISKPISVASFLRTVERFLS
jgi:two-component system, cell cycle response regulator DivK